MKKLFSPLAILMTLSLCFSCSNSNDKEGTTNNEEGVDAPTPVSEKAEQVLKATPGNAPFYIVNVTATKTKAEAIAKVKELKAKDRLAGQLWIPDYASLSGADYYAVFIGPFKTQKECEEGENSFFIVGIYL